MGDIIKGDTFVDGQQVTGARLNNLVDLAVIQAALITGKAQVVPLGSDLLLFCQFGLQLRKCLVSSLPFCSSVGLSMPTSEFLVNSSPITGAGVIAVSKKAQVANTVFASPDVVTGVPVFRKLVPNDLVAGGTSPIPAAVVDWNLALQFDKTITGNFTPSFINTNDGQSIVLIVQQGGGGTLNWSSIANLRWPNGTTPPQINTTVGRVDLYEFTLRHTTIYGKAFQNYF